MTHINETNAKVRAEKEQDNLKKIKGVLHVDFDSGHDFGIESHTSVITEDMTKQEQRQHYIKLLEGFDYIPKKSCSFKIMVLTGMVDYYAWFSFDRQHGGWYGSFKRKHKTIISAREHHKLDRGRGYPNPFVFIATVVNQKLKEYNFRHTRYKDTTDIAFMKNLWTQLSKIKNESL